MNKDAMNQGVQILLDRMDTNPEEFDDYTGKWGDIIGAVHARKSIPEGHSKDAPLPFLTDPEVNALYDKLEDVRRENFTSDVLRRLADDSVKQQELWANVSAYSTSNHPVLGTPSLTTKMTGAIGATGTVTVTPTLTKEELHLKKLQIEEMKAQARQTNAIARAFGK
jgi:hypothetical protein